jgi:hypothetical protein
VIKNKLSKNKLVCRIKGGLGNQMFIYASGKYLAKLNNAQLIMDNITGFKYDTAYKRTFRLNVFELNIEYANYFEMFLPFDKLFRNIYKLFFKKKFIVEKNLNYDMNFINIKFKGKCWVDGYWQNENYFIDISDEIKEDFKVKNIFKLQGIKYINKILHSESVAVHFRNYSSNSLDCKNLDNNYYDKAFFYINSKVLNPHFFIFADNPSEKQLQYIEQINNATIIETNSEIADMHLMSNCKYLIIANSSFSWWAAWLASYPNKIVIAPQKQTININSGFSSIETPESWVVI